MPSDGGGSQALAKDAKSGNDSNGNAKSKDSTPTGPTVNTASTTSTTDTNTSPRKRRKVNHGMLYSDAALPPYPQTGREGRIREPWANFGSRSYSLCILSSICKHLSLSNVCRHPIHGNHVCASVLSSSKDLCLPLICRDSSCHAWAVCWFSASLRVYNSPVVYWNCLSVTVG